MNRPRYTGFTLVEMSIVLVVIGLLVGGVLIGQELIRSNELTRISSDALRYQGALNIFLEKYNALPGDMPNATKYWPAKASCPTGTGTGTCDGDGDGNIGIFDGNNPICIESTRAWQHMALSNIISGQYTGAKPVGTTSYCGANAGENAPGTSFGNGAYSWMLPNDYTAWLYFSIQKYNMLYVGGTHSGTDLPVYALFTTTEAFAIDTKVDDGKPGQGRVQSQISTSPYSPGCTSTNVAATATYVTSNTSGPLCPLIFSQ